MVWCSRVYAPGVCGASAYSLSVAARAPCTPSIAALHPRSDHRRYEHFRAEHDGSYIPKFNALPTGITQLLVFSINARGLDSKIGQQLALLVDFEEVACLQEAAPFSWRTSLKGVPYRLVLGPAVPAGAQRSWCIIGCGRACHCK